MREGFISLPDDVRRILRARADDRRLGALAKRLKRHRGTVATWLSRGVIPFEEARRIREIVNPSRKTVQQGARKPEEVTGVGLVPLLLQKISFRLNVIGDTLNAILRRLESDDEPPEQDLERCDVCSSYARDWESDGVTFVCGACLNGTENRKKNQEKEES